MASRSSEVSCRSRDAPKEGHGDAKRIECGAGGYQRWADSAQMPFHALDVCGDRWLRGFEDEV